MKQSHLWSALESALTFAVMVAEEIGNQKLVSDLLVVKQRVIERCIKDGNAPKF